jgi:hypothetical protein
MAVALPAHRPDIAHPLDDPERDRRREALMLATAKALPVVHDDRFNLHCHSFFSYNANGWSPTRVAWELRGAGAFAGGLVDFDALDGMEEFHHAGRLLGLKTNVSLETRTFNTAFADKVIDSPGEPGVSYVCASGFALQPPAHTPAAEFLTFLRRNAADRNRALVDRINRALPLLAIQYDQQVVPRSPGGSPTERHIMDAYITRLGEIFPEHGARAAFLADLLHLDEPQAHPLLRDANALAEKLRARLAKKGGIAYVQPGPQTFPPLSDFFRWARACGAIPMESWLDGSSEGEADPRALFEASREIGAVALNIIPDRNWSIADPADKARKVANLHTVLGVARDMGWPVQIGTELNKIGQPLLDNLAAEALAPHLEFFRRSALLLTGHCLSVRLARVAYGNPNGVPVAGITFSDDGETFAALGALPPITQQLFEDYVASGPERAEDFLRDSVRAGRWITPTKG